MRFTKKDLMESLLVEYWVCNVGRPTVISRGETAGRNSVRISVPLLCDYNRGEDIS